MMWNPLMCGTLYKEIMKTGKILIILDDVWQRIDLSKLGIPRYKDLQMCKSKVLFTTRIKNVCHVMRCQRKIILGTLSQDDSWTLFERNTGISFESMKFIDVAKKVAKECRGLPIALIAVARALGDKDLEEWEKVAEQLKRSEIANPDHEEDAFRCLKLSYDYLKDENYKSYFLLCCLFLEDDDNKIEDLFAIGKGLFRHTDTICEAKGLADSVVKHLKDSSLLLTGDEDGCVRMHDVIRDTAIRIAKSEEDGHGFLVRAGHGLEAWSNPSHESYSAISLMKNRIRRLGDDQLVCPDLQILLLQENDDLTEIPETFFQSANKLRVLDLRETSISLLPQSFSLLTNLQALYLDCCTDIIDFSVLGKLKKLEILGMKKYRLKELSREIEHLSNLRMLDVSGAENLVTIPSKVISKLHRLEELYMMYCGFRSWERQIEGSGMSFCGLEETNIGFGELAGLPKLRIMHVFVKAECMPQYVKVEPCWVYFHIRIGGCLRNKGDRFDRNSNSRCLLLSQTTAISTLPDWFVNAVTSKIEKLEYDCCKGMSNIVMEFDRGRLHEVKYLRVAGNFFDSYVYLEELMNTTRRVKNGPVFEKLEELHLIHMFHLKELCVGEFPPGSF